MGVIDIILDRRCWFISLIAKHLMLAGIAILLAGSIGLLLGILIYYKKKLAGFVLGITSVLYTIPDIAMFGFLIPLTGIGDKTAIIALTVYSLLPMIRNTYTGLTQVDEDIIEAAVGMGSTKFQMLIKIQLPLAFPVILAGMRNMVVMAVSIAGIASFIGAGGLGQAIYRGIATNNQQLMLAGSVLIAFIAIVLDSLFGLCQDRQASKSNSKRRLIILPVLCLLFIVVLTGELFDNPGMELTVAYDNTAEESIIANMLILLIEDNTDIKVHEKGDLAGGETVMHPAIVQGEIDIYPEYTGTAWLTILKHKDIPEQHILTKLLNTEFNEKYDLSWIGMYGFNNSYGIAVKKSTAEQYRLRTYSDLAAVSGRLTFGAEPGFFERRDGYSDLCRIYGFQFKSYSDITFSLKYDAIKQNKVDVITVFTTDGRLADSGLIVLEDDKSYFPKYLCGNVVRNETLERCPDLKYILELTENLISDEEMSELNKQVEIDGFEAREVAKQFLIKKGLLE